MTLKEIYEALEKIDNGAELITGIKTEVNKLNNEAKKHHEAGEQNGIKAKALIEALGSQDGDDVVENAKNLETKPADLFYNFYTRRAPSSLFYLW